VVIPSIAGLGNSLMTMPMVRQLKLAWPDAKITILARNNSFAEMFRRMPEVDEVLVAGLTFNSPKNLLKKLRSRWHDLKGFARMIRWTRQRKPDLYLIPFPSNRWEYSILTLTSGARKRLLHSYPAGYFRALHFIGQRIPAEEKIHDVVQELRMLKALGITPDENESPRFIVRESDRARAAELLASVGLDRNFIVIHAGSGSYTVIARAKRWNPQKYAELIDRMLLELDRPILLVEGPDETGVAESIVKHLSPKSPTSSIPQSAAIHTLKLSGPLGETAAILERASLYVGSDSGIAHLAAAVGKRAVTIFAPADPDRVCPFGSRDLVVQTPNTCSPCFTYPFKTPYTDSRCKEPYCIEQVTVDQVLAAVRRGLSDLHPLPVASSAGT
jgi:ADP-heptose:LPS heptosyltransferase